jgi:periplasmic divalent cation tolerance protein
MNMETKFIIVLVTTPNIEEAQKISQVILDSRKAACVNIIPSVNSTYWWLDNIESAAESMLVIKTEVRLLNAVTKLVKKNHSYTTPEIIALPIVGGNPDYLKWLEKLLK